MTLPPDAPLRVAVLGAGFIGTVHRRSALLAGARVVGVLASTPARSREVGERWGCHGYADLDEVLAGDADVVHVTTPNAQHAPAALAALAAGKHVVCEKPLGVDLAQAQQLAAAARAGEARGLVTTVPFVYRYHPLVREVRARREAGELGRLHLLHGTYLQDWLLDPAASSWRVDPVAGGPSRAFADIGSHWVDLAEFTSGEVFTRLVAQTAVTTAQRPTGAVASFGGAATGALADVTTEDAATVLLRTAGGALGSLVVSQVSAGRKNRLWLELDGADGSAVFDQEDPERLWLGGLAASTVVARDPGSGSPEQRRLSVLPAGHAQGYAGCFDAFVADAHAAVRAARAGRDAGTGGADRPDGLPTAEDGLRAAAATDAVLRSAATRAWADVDTTRDTTTTTATTTTPGGDRP